MNDTIKESDNIPYPDAVCTLYNESCITGVKKHLPDNSIDLIITDPPYGINGNTLHKHYNRDEEHVVPGYVEIPEKVTDYSQSSGYMKHIVSCGQVDACISSPGIPTSAIS